MVVCSGSYRMLLLLVACILVVAAISQTFVMGKDRLQPETKFPATVLGGPSFLRGNFLLADISQVMSESWWEAHPNVSCAVNCVRREVTA